MIPTESQLVDAQHAINRQKPALAVIPEGQTALFELTALQAATIATALGVATIVVREGVEPTPVQVGWAAIIESALLARGGARHMPEVLAALRHVEASTLERMACLVLAHVDAPTVRASTTSDGKLTIEIGTPSDAPDTPETVAAKCIAARALADAFRNGRHPATTFSPEVEPKGGRRR